MAADADITANTEKYATSSKSSYRGVVAKIFLAILLILFAIVIGGYFWVDSKSGHRFVEKQIEAMEFENGLRIEIGAIQGSLYKELRIDNLVLRDPEGKFASLDQMAIDWRPLSYLSNHIDVRSLIVPQATLHRMPQFREVADTDDPILPDIDIDIGKLSVERLIFEKPVTGNRQIAVLNGRAKIADRRAQIWADGHSLTGPDMAGGEKFRLKLDAVPDKNQLELALNVDAPPDGIISALTGINKPLALRINGKGDWNSWSGMLTGQSGDSNLANLSLNARDGKFFLKGDMRPDLLFGSIPPDLAGPALGVDMSFTMENRIVDLSGNLTSNAAKLDAAGKVDLGDNSFDDLQLVFAVIRPAAIAPDITGQNINGRLLLNGSFMKPTAAYSLTAGRIAFNDMAVQELRMSGEAKVDSDRIVIPVSARASRIAGLNSAAGDLLNNVRLNGDLAIAGGRILSDNMKIRSDKIDATAILVADMNSGLYTGALKGKVNGYNVASVGIFNIETDVDLETAARGGFQLSGNVKARSVRLFNDGARDFLGGNALASANIRYGTDGIFRFSNLRASAPLLKINGGEGSYSADGRIRLATSGFSEAYGPLGVKLSGTINAPVAEVSAQRPGFGVGLANVIATIRPGNRGFLVNGRGMTDYGPVQADLNLLTGSGPIIIAINRADFAGIALSGRVQQTPSGPFAGALSGIGSGFDGDILLSSFEGKQRAVIDATASNASLSGPTPLRIGRAIIAADIILYDNPKVTADVQVANGQVGDLFLGVARAKINYAGGNGAAKIFAEGRSNVPFRIAANADLKPDIWRMAANGRINGINVKTIQPARIIPGKSGYQLLPSRFDLGKGTAQLAGSYGRGIKLQSRLNDVDFSVLRPFFSGMQFSGTASGSLDWEQASTRAFPSADARLTINNFTRSSIAAVSRPVDINLVGRLLPDGGNMRAIFRRRDAVIGRMQANLTPLPPTSGSWTERLLAAPLSGGVRYNGPAETLFSLAALPDQTLSGTIGVAADFSGRVQNPQLAGVVRANNLTYENESYGTRLTKMRVRGSFTGSELKVSELTANAGKGTVKGAGFVSLSSAEGYPLQLDLVVQNAKLADSNMIAAQATGSLQIVNNSATPAIIKGTISLPETRYKIIRQSAAQVATLSGVRRKPALNAKRITGDPDPITSAPSNWKLDIRLVADNKLFVSGMGLESEWKADLRVGGTTSAPIITGDVDLVRGTLGFAGRSFQLESGQLDFTGGDATNPRLRLSASSEVDDVTVNVNISGPGNKPDISFSSSPSLPQDEIMARILFGNSIGELSAVQAVQLASSLNSLRGGSGGLNPLGVIQSAVGIDRLRILGADEKTGRGTAVAVGQYISNDIYVEIVTDARGYTASQIEISLTPALSVLSRVGSFGGSSVNVKYRKDY